MLLGAALVLGACASPGAHGPDPQPQVAAAAPDGAGAAGASTPGSAADTPPVDGTGESGARSQTVRLRSVTETAAALDADTEGRLGVVVLDLQTRERASHRAHDHVPPASLYKLFVAVVALNLVDNGVLTLDTPVGGGICPTVETAMHYMITVSDNPCARTLAGHVGWEVIESYVRQHDFDGTSFLKVQDETGAWVPGLHTTAADVADLLRDLAEGDLLSPTSTAHLTGLLEAQHFASPLSEALGPGTDLVFKHKLGTLDHVSHDAGIVVADGRRYVVVGVTSGWSSGAAGRAEPLLSGVGAAMRAYVHAQAG